MARRLAGYYYPINPELCIYPTEPYDNQETQFEAFQSVLAVMLSADADSPYVALATMYNLPVEENDIEDEEEADLPNGIYYKPEYMGSTHYLAVRNGKVYDPYDYFQPPHTQGFCQMFAFFLAVYDINDFQQVPYGLRSTSRSTLDKYAHNTYTVLQKLLQLLNTNRVFDAIMRASFQRIEHDEYGIRCESYARFKRDLGKLTLTDVMYYIVDNPLPGDTYAQTERLLRYIR